MMLADTLVSEALSGSDKTAIYRTPEGIVAFVRDILHAPKIAPYQEEILANFVRYRRASVRGPHGLGKTAVAAWVILWGATCHGQDVKIVTTASAWRQLIYFTWPEVRKWARRADWSQLGIQLRYRKELMEYSIKLPGVEAFAAATDNPALIEGAHARTILYVFDEAKAIPPGIWDAAEGAFSGAGDDTDSVAYALAISTPGEPSGRFHDIHKRAPGTEDWWVRHVTLAEAITAGRVSREWAEQRKRQWGENSAVYQNRVLGDFATSADDSVIPLAWVEMAIERWRECQGKGEGKVSYGVDPARYGEDATAIARLVGRVLEKLERHHKEDTMQTAGRVAAVVKPGEPIAIDTVGLGAGVFDRLRELKYTVLSVNAGEKTERTDSSGQLHFVNLRSCLWWLLRESLDPQLPEPIALPDDPLLIGDLTAPMWKYTSSGLIVVEPKEDTRKRLGRSPDSADALANALYAQTAQTSWLLEGFDYDA